jgi:hypothetical protein
MTIRSRQFAGLGSAIVLGTLVLAVESTPLYAAEECLSGPKGVAPNGSHWYYRIDRATKKNCWYVRAERKQKPVATSSEARALPQAETPLQPSVANARAEADPAVVARPNVAAPEPAPFAGAASVTEPASAAETGQSTVASRWLDQPAADTANAASPPPAASDQNPVSSAPPAGLPVAADVRSPQPSPLFPPLLLVMIGALAAAALVMAAVFRFGRARRDEPQEFDSQRHAPWDVVDLDVPMRSPPLATEAAAPASEPVREHREAAIPDEIAHLLSTLSKQAPA